MSLSKKVEFYFADANLPYDRCTNFWVLSFHSVLNERFRYRFMWTLYMKDPEHWIPIQTVASFKRMRQFSSRGLEWVTNALRLSNFLQVDETGTKVRRTTEPQPPKNQFERSVYAVRVGILLLIFLKTYIVSTTLLSLFRKVSEMRNPLCRDAWRNSLPDME